MMKEIFRRQRIDFGLSGEGVQMIALSLFILLLAFFIMMNSASRFSHKKVEQALTSVQETFGMTILGVNMGPALTKTPQMRQGSGTATLQDEVAHFAHEVPGLKPVYVQRSGIMTITFSMSEWNRLLGLTGAHQVHPELLNFISFVTKRSPVRYDLFLLLNHRPALFKRTPYMPAITDAYLLMWVDALQQLGLPESRLSYGVAPGPAGTVTLMVRPPELLPQTNAVAPSDLPIDPFSPPSSQSSEDDPVSAQEKK